MSGGWVHRAPSHPLLDALAAHDVVIHPSEAARAQLGIHPLHIDEVASAVGPMLDVDEDS
jgi:hypothetical protein